jgi:hypothetical protein
VQEVEEVEGQPAGQPNEQASGQIGHQRWVVARDCLHEVGGGRGTCDDQECEHHAYYAQADVPHAGCVGGM